MDSISTNPLVPQNTPRFGDNAQDLLNTGLVNLRPTGIIVVNSTADVVGQPGQTTLRDAINKANADPGEDLIVFNRSLFSTAQTITLSGKELDITHSLDIIAPRDTLTGGDLVTVSGNKASRVFEIETGATVNLSGLIVADGSVTYNSNGGGIKNAGTLTLDSSIVRNNSAITIGKYSFDVGEVIDNAGTFKVNNSTISGNSSGGILNGGTLQVNNSTISDNQGAGISNGGTSTVNNSTISGNQGVGISNGGTLQVNNSTISANKATFGGGISNGGTLQVNNSTISANKATFGGGISSLYEGTLQVNNSTISDNSAGLFGGGIYESATISSTVNNSTISDNSAGLLGGGIYESATTNSTVNNSTISDNSAGLLGGGIYNEDTLKVNNSTISGNSATQNGGGIYNEYFGTLTLLFSTITQNIAANGGGVYQSEVPPSSAPNAIRGSNNVRNTIIAANLNSTGGVNPDVSGTFTSNGYNLIGDSTGSTGFGVTGDIVGTSANPIDPLLAPLAFNGGPTQTIALLPGSPAINAGDPTVLPTDPKTDQRGRRRVQRGRADIGAFESSLKN